MPVFHQNLKGNFWRYGKEGQVNYLQCGTCVDKQEVCDADDE